MIERSGKVAMKYFQVVPQRVKIGAIEYRFETKHNVCMCWVNEGDVVTILNITRTCCGGHKNHPYRYANESDVRIWEGTAER